MSIAVTPVGTVNTASSTATSVVSVPAGSIAVGDRVVIGINRSTFPAGGVSATDNAGNTYTPHGSKNESIDASGIACLSAPVTSVPTTITVNFNTGFAAKSAQLVAVSGLDPAAFDVLGSTASSFPHAQPMSASGTNSQAQAIIFGLFNYDGTGTVATAGTNYTGLTSLDTTQQVAFMDYRIVSVAGVQSPLASTGTTGGSWSALMAAFKELVNVPATGPGQMGWGTMGAGNMGSSFGAVSSTPVSAADAGTVSEGASVVAIAASVTDAQTHSEGSSAISAVLTRLDSWGLGEASSLLNTLATADAGALTDASSLAMLLALSATDAASITETSNLLTTLALSASDATVLAEASSILANLNVTEAAALAEASAVAATLGVLDSWALAEAATVLSQLSLSANDSWALSEASAVAASLAVSDSVTVTDLATLAVTLSLVDSAVLTELAQSAQQLLVAASDTATLAEASGVAQQVLLAVLDAFTGAELSALAAATSASDVATHSEAPSSVSATITATDVASGTEQPGSTSTSLTVSDALAVSEQTSLAVALAAAEALSITDASQLAALRAAVDSFVEGEASFVLVGLPAPPIHFPTRAALLAYASAAQVDGVLLKVDIEPHAVTVGLASKLFLVTTTPHTFDAGLVASSTAAAIAARSTEADLG